MAYLGYPGNAARCTFAVGEPIFAPLAGEWTHFAWSYDGTSMKAYVDGTLAQQDDVTAGGAIVYPPSDYESSQGGWFTIGAYHDTNGECACTVPPICAFSKPQKCCYTQSTTPSPAPSTSSGSGTLPRGPALAAKWTTVRDLTNKLIGFVGSHSR